MVPSLVTLTDL